MLSAIFPSVMTQRKSRGGRGSRWMDAGLGPTTAAWSQAGPLLGSSYSTGLDYSGLQAAHSAATTRRSPWGSEGYPSLNGQEAARSSSGGFQAPGMGRVEYSSGSASHVPDRAHSSNSDSSSTARPSHNGGPANESTSCLAKGPTSLMDPSCADMQGSMHQRQSVKPSANSYAGVTRNLSSDGLAAEASMSRIPGAGSHEALDQLAAGTGRMHSMGNGGQTEGAGHRQGTGSGTEDDIFSHVVGGLDLEAEQRSSSYGQGLSNLPQSSSSSRLHPGMIQRSERDTRVIIVEGINPDMSEHDYSRKFQEYGDIRTFYTALSQQWVLVGYYDLFAAKLAKNSLNGQIMYGARVEASFSAWKEAREHNEGMLTMTNHNPSLTNEQIKELLESNFGPIYSIETPYNNPYQRNVEFMDVRHAQKGRQAIGQSAKIPTISESGTGADDGMTPGGPIRNVQSMHTFYPQSRPGASSGPPQSTHVQDGARPHSWDNSNADAQLNNLQNLLGSQQILQQIASLNQQQGVYNNQGALGNSNSFNNLSATDLDTLIRAGNLDNMQATNNPLQGMVNPYPGSNNSLSSLQSAQAGSHPNLVGLGGRSGMHPGRGQHRSSSQAPMESPRDLLSAGSQHMSASQLLALVNQGQDIGAHAQAQADPASTFGRRPTSMSTGNLTDLGGYQQPRAVENLLGNSLPAPLRGVASTSNIWDSQNMPSSPSAGSQWAHLNQNTWPSTGGSSEQVALQAQALALQLSLSGNLDQGIGAIAPQQIVAMAQQQQLQNLTQQLQSQLSLQNMNLNFFNQALRNLASQSSGHIPHKGSREDLQSGRLSRRTADPAAEAERKAAQEKMFSLDMEKVTKGEDKRTTLMVKNIPNKYTQKMLLSTIDEQFKGQYDFFYLPIDFKNKCNVGYAFLNMVLPEYIPALYQRFHAKKWEKFNSEKVCNISYARIQGKSSLIHHFSNSSLLHEDKRCRPIIFRSDGKLAGEQEPFPVASHARSRPSRSGSAGNGLNTMGTAGPSSGAGNASREGNWS